MVSASWMPSHQLPGLHPLVGIDRDPGSVRAQQAAAVTQCDVNQIVRPPHRLPAIQLFLAAHTAYRLRGPLQILPGADLFRIDARPVKQLPVVIHHLAGPVSRHGEHRAVPKPALVIKYRHKILCLQLFIGLKIGAQTGQQPLFRQTARLVRVQKGRVRPGFSGDGRRQLGVGLVVIRLLDSRHLVLLLRTVEVPDQFLHDSGRSFAAGIPQGHLHPPVLHHIRSGSRSSRPRPAAPKGLRIPRCSPSCPPPAPRPRPARRFGFRSSFQSVFYSF